MACGAAYRSRFTTRLGPGLYYLFVDGYSQADWPCPCGDFAVTLSGI
jgi:hypothetical protein